jgi:XTP/dITP diphosphohydrolase
MKLIIASANEHKIREIKQILPVDYTILGLKDIGLLEEIPETGATIRQNSYLKANYVAAFLKQNNKNGIVFADDSGLEVEALNNEPGVLSARYAGEKKNDEANNRKLLSELKNITNRNARFITIITLIMEGQTHYFTGIVNGSILHEARGKNGFGYDPLFVPEGFDQSFAEMNAEQKNKISHRFQAIEKFKEFLNKKV